MQYLQVDSVSKRYGEKLLFENISFLVNKGDKVALVAANGTGKSSLVRALAGIEKQDSGSIHFARDIRVEYLVQEPAIDSNMSILENVLFTDNLASKAIINYEKALSHPAEEEAMNRAIAQMDAAHAWDYETRVKQLLFKLDIKDFNQNAAHLSGGEKKRVALAKVLVNEPDFLILDEPTNHLDVEMIEWLEEWLIQSKMTLFLITHDRYFLERVCTRIIEIVSCTITVVIIPTIWKRRKPVKSMKPPTWLRLKTSCVRSLNGCAECQRHEVLNLKHELNRFTN